MRQELSKLSSEHVSISRSVGIAERGGDLASGNEIDQNGLRLFPVGRNLQNRGTAQSAMRDQHLLLKLLTFTGSNNSGGNAGQIAAAGAIFRIQRQRNESGAGE